MTFYLEQQSAISATLLFKIGPEKWIRPYDFPEGDMTGVESVIRIREPMQNIIRVLCDEDMPTVSVIHSCCEMMCMSLTVSKPGLATHW